MPDLQNADAQSMFEIAQENCEHATKAYDRQLKPDEMRGGSMTISNVGYIGGGWYSPVIQLPEVAILGVGKIE